MKYIIAVFYLVILLFIIWAFISIDSNSHYLNKIQVDAITFEEYEDWDNQIYNERR